MAIETVCSGCGQRLAVADEHAGKRARCPSCGQIYAVPLPASATEGGLANSAPGWNSGPATHPSLADTTAGVARPEPSMAASNFNPPDDAQYWMQTADGMEYGPVDRLTLERWFEEGRVGQRYQIRQGQAGPWQPASIFQPRSANPYSNQWNDPYGVPNLDGSLPHAGAVGPAASYPKGDPSGLVLTMGILAWVFTLTCGFIGWIPGLVAWVKGGQALKDIRNGLADPTNISLVQTGYYLGMVNVIITLIMTVMIGLFMAVMIISEM